MLITYIHPLGHYNSMSYNSMSYPSPTGQQRHVRTDHSGAGVHRVSGAGHREPSPLEHSERRLEGVRGVPLLPSSRGQRLGHPQL